MISNNENSSTLEDLLNNKFNRENLYSTTQEVIKKFKKKSILVGGVWTILLGFGVAGFFNRVGYEKEIYADNIKKETEMYIDNELQRSVENRVAEYDTLVDDFVTYKIDKTLDRELQTRIENRINTYFKENGGRIVSRTEKLINEKIDEEIKKYRLENEKLNGTYIESLEPEILINKSNNSNINSSQSNFYFNSNNSSNSNNYGVNPEYEFMIHYNKDNNLLSLYSILNDEVLAIYNCIDGKVSGQKNSLGDNKTPEGLYKIENVQDERDTENIPRLGSLQIKVQYPNQYETKKGFLGNGILIRSSDNINQIMAISKKKDITNGDIVMHNSDLISLYEQIENKTDKVLIGIENSKYQFNFKDFMRVQYESYQSN